MNDFLHILSETKNVYTSKCVYPTHIYKIYTHIFIVHIMYIKISSRTP